MGEEINKEEAFEELCLHANTNRGMPILVRIWACHGYFLIIKPDISSSKQNVQAITKNSQQTNKPAPA